MKKRPYQIASNIGLFYVCHKLSLLNWNVIPNSRNSRGIDLVSFSLDGKKRLTFQVKTLYKKNPFSIGSSLENISADFLVVVVLHYKPPRCFILLSHEVRALSSYVKKKDGTVHYFVDTGRYMVRDFSERWDRIGPGA